MYPQLLSLLLKPLLLQPRFCSCCCFSNFICCYSCRHCVEAPAVAGNAVVAVELSAVVANACVATAVVPTAADVTFLSALLIRAMTPS
jgi:hypothetical protein